VRLPQYEPAKADALDYPAYEVSHPHD
jgi:hypothetical protein